LKKITLYLVAFISIVFTGHIAAQTFEFTENKGQWNSEVLFKGELSNGAFFLKKNGYRVVQHSPADFARIKATVTGHEHADAAKGAPLGTNASTDDTNLDHTSDVDGTGNYEKSLILRSHAYDVVFEGANAKASIQMQKILPGTFNYFLGNDPARWAGNVHAYGEVWMQQLYPGIDIRYYSDNGFLKFDFIVQPNAPIEKIAMLYNGAESLSLRNGELVVKTSVNEVIEQSPYSYQLVNGIRQQVQCKYVLTGNKVRFKLSGYDPTQTLVITGDILPPMIEPAIYMQVVLLLHPIFRLR
jgi:hypothetical protein